MTNEACQCCGQELDRFDPVQEKRLDRLLADMAKKRDDDKRKEKLRPRPAGTETNLTKSIIRRLHKIGDSFAMKIVGSGYQISGVPDILFILYNRHKATTAIFFFEVKVGKNKATAIQLLRISQLRTAGAVAEVVRSWQDVFENIEQTLTKEQLEAVT